MSNYDITIHARDRQQVSFVCSEAEDLLSAADRESILLPSQCREGTCGACVATVTAGSYHLGEVSMEVLPEQVQARGEVLLCRTYPREDLILEAPYDYNYIRFERISEREAEVIDVMMVATGTRRLLLRLQPDEQGGAAEFEAGQFMEIQVPGSDARRAYSLANNTNWNGDLEFFITLRPGGAFSTYLESALVGDRLNIRGPLGTCTLRENGLRPRWFIGGGTGLVPLLSMLRRMADWGEMLPARLYFGARYEDELFCQEEIRQIQEKLPQLQVKICLSRPGNHWMDYRGSVVDALRDDLGSLAALPDLYVCGSTRLVQGVTELALNQGLPDSCLQFERFLSA
ncbi:FAD-binding oxidoreductase [Acidithiobacillus ferrooxidans]|uniref:FAD-binding oxidoreductase n=3 Tax=Acidithiobacillus ferrooxidans TaxID=920 RepID=UPI000A502785|nr:FAD-binding oxidoreductase [Acidithiobacillus ferrooxidans]